MLVKYVTCLTVNDTRKYSETDHLLKLFKCSSVGGVTVSMVAFQAVDPGSTPGRRTRNFVSWFRVRIPPTQMLPVTLAISISLHYISITVYAMYAVYTI